MPELYPKNNKSRHRDGYRQVDLDRLAHGYTLRSQPLGLDAPQACSERLEFFSEWKYSLFNSVIPLFGSSVVNGHVTYL